MMISSLNHLNNGKSMSPSRPCDGFRISDFRKKRISTPTDGSDDFWMVICESQLAATTGSSLKMFAQVHPHVLLKISMFYWSDLKLLRGNF